MTNVLVVDDERDVPDLFQQRFRKEIKSGQIHMEFVYSGSEAIDYLKLHNGEIELILSDINMPGMDGLEMLRQLRQKTELKCPVVIMISAYGDENNYKIAMEYGAEAFLTKPIDFNDLKQRLQQHIQS
ncbi:MAG: response regulator [Saprospiraceae bacterium]|nr:response regulator [Saprospiraceae bacterium]MBK7525631.1 response regulator [Saprospiraceae bacterium]MBK8080239.1 response regulator [Saprospiraceae bacterium]MBK8373171.1 response regulator [Saprospiraceae bacterium]MBK8545984.1 response regulator [Saprospiraceae bacterium]